MQPEFNAISILIVHYRSEASLERCLHSVMALAGAIKHDVIVIDNASPEWDETSWKDRFPKVRFLSRRVNDGFGAAANAGAALASGSWFWILNADTVLFPSSLSELCAVLPSDPEVGALGTRLLCTNGSLQLSARGFPRWWAPLASRYSPLTLLWPQNPLSRLYVIPKEGLSVPREVDWVSGASMVLRRQAFEAIGGFDPSFFLYMEDVDICRRLNIAGWKVLYDPRAAVVHSIGASSSQARFSALAARHKSIWRYYAKHAPRNIVKDAAMAMGVLARFVATCAVAAIAYLVISTQGDAYREYWLKRPLDVMLSVLGLVLTAPLSLLTALLILCDDGGPVFYHQPRVGRHGRVFMVKKFRTMHGGLGRFEQMTQAGTQDPRVTRVGRFIRRAAIDEIPQLLNILSGDMSLVGPRALIPVEADAESTSFIPSEKISGWKKRVLMRPGLTGIAQLYGRRDLPRRQKFRLDLLYLSGHSLLFDIRLVLLSVWVSVTGSWGGRGRRRRMVRHSTEGAATMPSQKAA